MSLQEVNEQSTCYIDISFFDRNGDPVVPNSAEYWISDKRSSTILKERTAISGLGETVTIEVEPTTNSLLSQNSGTETRVVTVYALLVNGGSVYSEFQYLVVNLRDVPGS